MDELGVNWEAIAIAAVTVAGASAALLVVRDAAVRMRAAAGLVAAGLLLALAVATHERPPVGEAAAVDRPVERPVDGYVSSRTCKACHPSEYDSWFASYHRSMTQVWGREGGRYAPLPEGSFALRGWTYELEREGDQVFVTVDYPQPDGTTQRDRRPIVMTTGSHHMQVYWFPSGETRKLAMFPFSWFYEEARLVPRSSLFVAPPPPEDAVEKPTSILEIARWNFQCINCHATQGRARIASQDVMDTQAGELGIACESCHGPGQEHVEANRDPARRYALHLSGEPDPTIVNPASLEPVRGSQVCGQCHGISSAFAPADRIFDAESFQTAMRDWNARGHRYRPGENLERTRHVIDCPEDLDKGWTGWCEDSFWTDGTMRVAGRQYHGLEQSACEGLACTSCHELHPDEDDPRPLSEWASDQLGHTMTGDRACVQCHEAEGADLAGHSRHRADGPGARCYNCHMPHTVYGLMGAIRSHRIESPSVAVDLEVGRPNACSLCHLDRPLGWVAAELESGWGIEAPALDEERQRVAESVRGILTGDAGARALWAWAMGWPAAQETAGTDWQVPYLGQLLADPYDPIRYIAYRSLRTQPGWGDFAYDFVAPSDERTAAAAAVRERWQRGGVDRGGLAAAVLGDGQGRLSDRDFAALLARRDDTPVQLME